MPMEEIAVKTVRESILNSLLEIARDNKGTPSHIRHEMRMFLDALLLRPSMQRFFQLYGIPHDEFIRDIYDTAVSMLFDNGS